MMNQVQNKNFEKFKQEMRRGVIVLAAMSQLKQEQYGYSLIQSLNEKGFEVGQDTLYPLLRRLEQKQILVSQWRVEEPRPRRYYKLSDVGLEMYERLASEWRSQEDVIRRLIDETE